MTSALVSFPTTTQSSSRTHKSQDLLGITALDRVLLSAPRGFYARAWVGCGLLGRMAVGEITVE